MLCMDLVCVYVSCVWHCFWQRQSAPFLLQRGRHMMLTWLELQCSGWWQELTRPGPRRRWLEAAADSGLGQESPAGPGRDTSSTSHIDPRNCAPSPSTHFIKWGKNDAERTYVHMCECLSELRLGGNRLCEQPELVVVPSSYSGLLLLVVRCHGQAGCCWAD